MIDVGSEREQISKGSREIELTPEMIEAGTQFILESGFLEYDGEGAVRLMVTRLLQTSLAASPRALATEEIETVTIER